MTIDEVKEKFAAAWAEQPSVQTTKESAFRWFLEGTNCAEEELRRLEREAQGFCRSLLDG